MPAVRAYDTSYVTDLEERLAYELWTLEFFREKLFSQGEGPNSSYSFCVGDVTEAGLPRTHVSIDVACGLSDSAVRSALEKFRPLAFVSAFKLQDMIAEWILVANGSAGWGFAEKKKAYDGLIASGTFHEPDFLKLGLSGRFWALYKALESFRGAVTHTGGFEVLPDHGLKMTDRKGKSLVLTNAQQQAYIRFGCVLARCLVGKAPDSDYQLLILESALGELATIHGCGLGAAANLRYEEVKLSVPVEEAKSLNPYLCELDLVPYITALKHGAPVGPNGKLLFSLEITADAKDRTLSWRFPPVKAPEGPIKLDENDPALNEYRI